MSKIAAALRLHQQGKLAEAEREYDRLLVQSPNDGQALHLKGVARHQQGDFAAACDFLSRARHAVPGSGLTRCALAQALWAVNRHDQALEEISAAIRCEPLQAAFRQVRAGFLAALGRDVELAVDLEWLVERQPEENALREQLGNTCWKLGRLRDAVRHYQAIVERSPDAATANASLGSVLYRLGDSRAALEPLRRALALRPDFAQAHNNLGNALRTLGELAEAIQHFDRAIELAPGQAVFYDNRGLALQELERAEAAQADFLNAVRLDPELGSARLHLGLLLRDQRRIQEALSHFHEARRLLPGDAHAVNGIASCLFDLHRYQDARTYYEQAAALAPDLVAIRENLVTCACEQGDLESAARYCDEAHALERAQTSSDAPPTPGSPDRHPVRRALRMPPIFFSRGEIMQRRVELRHDLENLLDRGCRLQSAVREIRSAPFYIAYHGENERDLLSYIADFHARVDPSLQFVATRCQSPWRPGRRKRIGFISRYFCDHSVGLHFGGMLQELPSDRFEKYLIRVSPVDDHVARAIAATADHRVELSGDLERARHQIADCGLDLLIYTDLGMDYFTYFLAFARLAPVQCVLAGHPLTSGIPAIDYFLSNDTMEPADGADHYRERLVRLQSLMTRLARPTLPPHAQVRERLGFSPRCHVYFCPQTLFKLHPDMDDLLAQILRADPLGSIVLVRAESPDWSNLLQRRFERSMPDVCSRIQWIDRAPMAEFLELLATSDVVLDTLHFNGGTTSMLALGVTAPIVTLPGPYMRGRTTRVCYDRMGFKSLIADDAAGYANMAVRLANDAGWRSECLSAIAEQSPLLFAPASAGKELSETLAELRPTLDREAL